MRGGGKFQVAEILPNYLKGAVINIIWIRKTKILSKKKKNILNPLKTYRYLLIAVVFWIWQTFFLYFARPGLATMGKKIILSKYLAGGAF